MRVETREAGEGIEVEGKREADGPVLEREPELLELLIQLLREVVGEVLDRPDVRVPGQPVGEGLDDVVVKRLDCAQHIVEAVRQAGCGPGERCARVAQLGQERDQIGDPGLHEVDEVAADRVRHADVRGVADVGPRQRQVRVRQLERLLGIRKERRRLGVCFERDGAADAHGSLQVGVRRIEVGIVSPTFTPVAVREPCSSFTPRMPRLPSPSMSPSASRSVIEICGVPPVVGASMKKLPLASMPNVMSTKLSSSFVRWSSIFCSVAVLMSVALVGPASSWSAESSCASVVIEPSVSRASRLVPSSSWNSRSRPWKPARSKPSSSSTPPPPISPPPGASSSGAAG